MDYKNIKDVRINIKGEVKSLDEIIKDRTPEITLNIEEKLVYGLIILKSTNYPIKTEGEAVGIGATTSLEN